MGLKKYLEGLILDGDAEFNGNDVGHIGQTYHTNPHGLIDSGDTEVGTTISGSFEVFSPWTSTMDLYDIVFPDDNGGNFAGSMFVMASVTSADQCAHMAMYATKAPNNGIRSTNVVAEDPTSGETWAPSLGFSTSGDTLTINIDSAAGNDPGGDTFVANYQVHYIGTLPSELEVNRVA